MGFAKLQKKEKKVTERKSEKIKRPKIIEKREDKLKTIQELKTEVEIEKEKKKKEQEEQKEHNLKKWRKM